MGGLQVAHTVPVHARPCLSVSTSQGNPPEEDRFYDCILYAVQLVNTITENTTDSKAVWASLPEPFNFYRLVLKGDHLHFGLWPEEACNDDLETAQERMFDCLLSFFPEAPADVLDVGCGLGASASLLTRKGYRVTAIAPSPELIGYARRVYADSHVDFQIAGFLDDPAPGFAAQTYDVILFQESFQYLHPLTDAVSRARSLLRDSGKMIIGDEVCLDRAIQPQTSVHHRQDLTAALAEQGFRIQNRLDIRNRVLPTCRRIIDLFTTHHDAICQAVNTDTTSDRLAFFTRGWQHQLDWYTQEKMGYDIVVCRKDNVFIRSYRENDEASILPMFREIFQNSRTLEHWNWKYRDNPFGRHHIVEAFSENGELAAHFAGYPIPFYRADMRSDIPSVQGGDTMTHPAFRSSGRGPTSLLSRTAAVFYDRFCNGVVPFIYGFNTGTIRKFGERFLQYEYLPEAPYHVRDVIAGREHWIEAISRRLKGVTVRSIHTVGPEFDAFFDRAAGHYGLLVKRNSRYLRWRYLDCPDRIHRMAAVFRRGKMTGWGVFSVRENTLIWGDALCDPEYIEDMAVLLDDVVNAVCEQSPVSRIAAWFSPMPVWWTDWLKEQGFVIIEEPNHLAPCFKRFSDDFTIDTFGKHLYYTMGDSDLF
jgi:SAM-dependent methyltransferase